MIIMTNSRLKFTFVFLLAFSAAGIVLFNVYKAFQAGHDNGSELSDSAVVYDTKPISSAYLSGDTSGLSDFDRQIYDKAVQVLDMIITDDMSDYEKELAVHDYLIYNVSYDESQLNVFYQHDKDSENPFGTLINHKAICTGYASSFQMFMDMLGIPCKTVAAKDSDNTDHVWNMVELDGEWYYVDVTWDDPIHETENSEKHRYFNVTEEYMRKNKHCWNSRNLPRADSTKYSYKY